MGKSVETAAPRIRTFSPIFGVLYLNEKSLTDEPRSAISIGYVRLEGRENLMMAIWQKGEWRTHRGKRFSAPVLSWFQVEKEDGSPAF